MYHYEKIEEAKKVKKETIFPQAHAYLDKLDAIVKKNGGYLVNCGQVRIQAISLYGARINMKFFSFQITWPDVLLTSISSYMKYMSGEDLFSSRKNLQSLMEKVMQNPGLKKYLEAREPPPY
jgi:Glutathione S-transferase, C-terminal domain